MRKPNLKLLIVCIVAGCVVTAGPVFGRTLFNIDCYDQWEEALGPNVRPLMPHEWDEYMQLWHEPANIIEGEPYPETTFVPPVLEVYPGGGSWDEGDYPEEAGLLMYWGPPPAMAQEEGDYASAWAYEYGEDPDLSRALIQVQVYAPQLSPFGLPGQITQISLGIQDQNYQRQAWYWNVGPGKTIPWNTWVSVTVNPSIAGVGATTPKADSFAGSPAFDVKNVTIMIFDENGRWVPGSINVPPPGQPAPYHLWNYWNYLMVVPNPNPTQPPQPVPKYTGKYHIKWSQPPEVIDSNIPQRILGWDERSDYKNSPIMADDWLCKDDRPVTDIHWWGSFIGWGQPYPPPVLPRAFHIGIWINVKAHHDPAFPFSHPDHLVWENFCDNWVWNFYGYDEHPEQLDPDYKETCFQFNQLLSEDEWFYQEPNEPNTIYWLSIAAIYDPNVYTDPNFYPWGWKTRPWHFEDDAVRTWAALNPDGTLWPPALKIGATWQAGDPVFWPDPDHSWDLAFELTTIYPDPNDDKPPGPDPIDWDIPPQAVAPTVITMTAKTATDESGVEYLFEEMTGNPGGDDSGWQDSSGYTDSGLDPNTGYAYRVKARDKSVNKNETGWSPPGTATTWLPYLVDYNVDKIVNFKDFAFFANKWLTSGP